MTTILDLVSGIESIPEDSDILVWRKDTWGNWGQHDNLYVFVIDLDSLTSTPIYKLVTTKVKNEDSRKNIHRYTYTKLSELKKLENVIFKVVSDYASSSKRTITVTYIDSNFKELKTETSLRDNKGYFDVVYINGKKLRVSRDQIEWIE